MSESPINVTMQQSDLALSIDPSHGNVSSLKLYGRELLAPRQAGDSELWVNQRPLKLRAHVDPNDPTRQLRHLKGEQWVDHFSGWALVMSRVIGDRPGLKHPCVGIQTLVRREVCDQTLPCPGPGGPVTEAPLHIDTLSILRWNWQFWGADTRMIFSSSHSSGPPDEFGHVGYEHDTPEKCKQFMQNVWRRIYPGCMAIHGGVYYDVKSNQWLAITCRRPNVGYILDIEHAGLGVSYDFTLHAPFAIGESLPLPEVKLYYGPDRESMMRWMADYVTHYYHEPPAWVRKTLFTLGLAWNNQPTWTEQADFWEKNLEKKTFNGISYSLVTNRPIRSGTTPLGYEPDPNHGTIDEFRRMCHRLADRGVPVLVWMSHSGLAYRGGPDIDDDWFIRGIDGRVSAAWGSIDGLEIAHINPGHPGYIEYTKKWIRFYIQECRCKGIFLDCLSWAFPPDFKQRSWMRFPGDTNRMAIKFMQEVHDCIKACDPEAILLGEGTSLDGPVDVFSVHSNPIRSIDGMGPRDFLLSLNQYASKRLVIDQGPLMAPASGFCRSGNKPEYEAHDRFLLEFLQKHGDSRKLIPLPGDLSVFEDLLFVPAGEPRSVKLPESLHAVRSLEEVITGVKISGNAPQGGFTGVPTGIYRMIR